MTRCAALWAYSFAVNRAAPADHKRRISQTSGDQEDIFPTSTGPPLSSYARYLSGEPYRTQPWTISLLMRFFLLFFFLFWTTLDVFVGLVWRRSSRLRPVSRLRDQCSPAFPSLSKSIFSYPTTHLLTLVHDDVISYPFRR